MTPITNYTSSINSSDHPKLKFANHLWDQISSLNIVIIRARDNTRYFNVNKLPTLFK